MSFWKSEARELVLKAYENGCTNNRDIAVETGLTVKSVQNRVCELRKSGVVLNIVRCTPGPKVVACKRHSRGDRMPPYTAQEYIEHYNEYGWQFFTRSHCPAHLYNEVMAYYAAHVLRVAA